MKKHLSIPAMAAIAALPLIVSCTKTDDVSMLPEIRIEVMESQDSACIRVLFIPDGNTASFDYAIGSAEDLSAFASGEMDNIERITGNDETEITFDGLNSGMTYSIFAKAYAANGKAGGVSAVKASPRDMGFTAETSYVLDNSAGFRIDMSQNYFESRYYLGKAEDSSAFSSGEIYGELLPETNSSYFAHFFSLEPGTEYVFYAIGTDRRGMESNLIRIPFITPQSSECPNASIDADIDIYNETYIISSNSECGSITAFVAPSVTITRDYFGTSNDICSTLLLWGSVGWQGARTETGKTLEYTYLTPDMLAGESMDLYIAFTDKGGNPAGVKKYSYTTPETDRSLERPSPVDVEVTNISTAGAVYNFSADETVFGYFYDTVDAEWYDALDMSGQREYFLENTFYSNFVEGTGYFHYGNGDFLWVETTGKSMHKYYATAIPINSNGPIAEGWGETTMIAYVTL